MNNRIICLTILIGFVLLIVGLNDCVLAYSFPEAKITAQVVGESDEPISDQEIRVGFEGAGGKGRIFNGRTDAAGRYTATHGTAGTVSFTVARNSYYLTYSEYDFKQMEPHKWRPKTYKWLPWNPEVKLLVRKIGTPVPMFARNSKKSGLRIPVVGKEVSFDLMEYAWMPPYGKGKHADLIFRLDETYKGENDFTSTLIITFPNKFDGIQVVKENLRNGSIFKLPRFAPEDGYQPKLKRVMRKSPGKSLERDFDNSNSYIFRVPLLR